MNQSYPVPPPELVQQWIRERDGLENFATQAAQWGADQELEACTSWLVLNGYGEAAGAICAAIA